jgi:hypothetical protein
MVIEAGIQRTEVRSMETDIITRRPPLTGRSAIVATCLALLAATACSNSGPTDIACSQVYVYGISLKVQNAVTGARITDSAAVQIKDGGYVEAYNYLGPADQPTSGVLSAAGERAGTYSISIRKDGFAPYDTAGIKVTRDVCHVHGVQVTAKLQPVAGG